MRKLSVYVSIFAAATALQLDHTAISAPLPTGAAYLATSGGTCPGAMTANLCELATVGYKNVWDSQAWRVVSIDDLTASLKVTTPVGQSACTWIVQIGGGGTGGGEANTYGASRFLQPIVDAGCTLVQVFWGTGSGNGMWGGSPSSSAYGGDSMPDGALDTGARMATLSEAICADTTLHPAGGCFGAGFSGGSSALTYACTRYGACDETTGWLHGIVLISGPPIGDLSRGCNGSTYPGWFGSGCSALRTSASGLCSFGNTPVSGQFTDLTWNDGRTGCALQNAATTQGGLGLGYSSALGGQPQTTFPRAMVRAVYADNDSSEAVPLGRSVVRRLADALGAAPVEIVTTGSVQHTVLDYTSGADAAKTAVLGGTYNGTTYSALAVTSSYPTASSWSPESIKGVELWLQTHALRHLWVEDYATQFLTHPAADGDTVRGFTDSVNAHEIAGSALTLASDAAFNSAVRFVRTDADWLSVKNSATGAFDFIHQTGRFSISFTFRAEGNDGVQFTLLDNANATTSNSGFQVVRTTGNKMQVQLMKSSAGTSVFNCTSTANLNVAAGKVRVIIEGGGNSANTGQLRMSFNGSVETCAQSSATPTTNVNAFQDLWIGRASGGGGACDCTIGDLVIANRPLSPADKTQLASWNPARIAAGAGSLLRYVGPPRWYNFLSRAYRFDLPAYLYTDTAGTTHVKASGDAIALVRPLNDPTGHLNRNGSQSTAANRPTWQGLGVGALFDGVNDSLTIPQSADHGVVTWLLTASNRDTTLGSHFAAPGGRILFTGSSYTGNATPGPPGHVAGQAYMTTHPGTGNTCTSDLPNQAAGALNTAYVLRNGANWTLGMLRRSNAVSLVNTCTASNSNAMHFTSLGSPAIASWDHDGKGVAYYEWAEDPSGDEHWYQVLEDACAYGGC